MKNVIFISGKNGTGKSLLAKLLAEKYDSPCFIENTKNTSFMFQDVTEKTDCLVFDEIPIEAALSIMMCDKIVIDKKHKNPFKRDCPDIIFTTTYPKRWRKEIYVEYTNAIVKYFHLK
jgi:cytidylate kinase